ncbi:MAG TPA: peptidylprolyl isomerase [Acidobacteriaceae bacterium]|nr:peptidylprolyl isomerase [Acidobacteriaceae bacterium]
MMLRVPLLPATLFAGLALSVFPAAAQRVGSLADDTQRNSAYSGSVVEEIIARVNDQVINKSDYERAQQELDQEARQQNWTQQQVMEQRRDLLRSLIDRQLLLSQGKQLGISGETDVVKRLDEIRKQNHLDSMEDLQKAVESQGISYEDFKQQIRENVITQQVISQQVGSRIQIAPSEIEAYYKSHQQEFQRPESVKLNEILIATPNPDDAAQVAAAEKKADDVEARLKAGGDFATLAKTESTGPTAQDGGRLGEYKRGDLPKVMEDATFDLQTGQFTQPIRTRQGWLILQVAGHEKAGQAPLNEVQNQIQEQVGMAKMEPALRQYLTTLRDQAYIDIRPGYVDSGASANELKFIQSAYVPPQPKKKKHVARARYTGRGRGRGAAHVQASKASAPPAGIPTLDQVNSSKGKNSQVAATGTQKPGKKEKIRFGQAPRETLPAGETRQVDAGATAPPPQNQVAINQSGMSPDAAPATAETADTATEKKQKTRYRDRLKEPKQKREQQRKEEWAATHHQKFVPPTQTPEEQAQDQRQNAALGLRGDTAKDKKANPAKTGPKRRISDRNKQQDQQQNGQQNPAPAGTTEPAAPAPAPATQPQP